jgi:hypothetical protein
MVLALFLNYVEMRPTFELLSELLSTDIFSVMQNFKDEYVRDFFAITGIEIIARSPLLSEYILKNFVSDDDLVEILLKALGASSSRFKRAKRYRDINSNILRFSVIEKLIMSKNNRYDRIQDFYDRAGEFGYKEFSPFYWLQYALAARSFRDYKAADRFFSESRRVASRKKDFLAYQVDNAYAQFLLESRAAVDYWSDFFSAFVEASTIAMQQTYLSETGMYAYRVASRFINYLEVRGSGFARAERRQAADICKSWISRIDGLPPGFRRNRIVKAARASAADSYDFLVELGT